MLNRKISKDLLSNSKLKKSEAEKLLPVKQWAGKLEAT